MADKAICVVGGGGLLLPLGGDDEQEWPRALRVILYLLGLGWCFMGVAIIADVFMGAIERITSKKTRKFNAKLGKWHTTEDWNATVANLTLMALGSSAPEILLNVIDIFAKGFFLEGLGPSTIVGSAAFNLLMIIAVCVMAIPDGEVRYIKETSVYYVTASFSVFAYVWLLVILLGISPNVVEVWEGVLTFLFFPILTGIAFLADKGYFSSSASEEKAAMILEGMSQEEIAEIEARVRKEHGQNLTTDQVARILAAQNLQNHTRAHYRVGATRAMFGGKRLKLSQMARQMTYLGSKKRVVPEEQTGGDPAKVTVESQCTVQFSVTQYAVLESAGTVTVIVGREGNLNDSVRVHYCTENGTAKEGEDYKAVAGDLEFAPGQAEAKLDITIIDDAAYESDENFFVQLSDVRIDGGKNARLNEEKSRATIIIIDDDDAGILSFPYKDDHKVTFQKDEDHVDYFVVRRTQGSSGEVKVSYKTEGSSALPGRDFEETSGTLVFADKQVEATIPITIKAKARYESVDMFRIILSDPKGGAKLNTEGDGGAERNILSVTIAADDESKERIDKLKSVLQVKWDKSKVGHTNWATQFKEAFFVNGGVDDEDGDEAPSIQDYVMHYIALPWKLLFALVPPTDYCGGWVCFVCALLMIGFVTMIIGDMASLLGCVMCIPDDITAITFVALGTSLPDTFASKTAATQDRHADASVGNVTGSNSVNVFLGLGLPWMIASINWAVAGKNSKWQEKYQELTDFDLDFLGSVGNRSQGFVVEAGSLAFSVAIFSCCAACCIALLAIRRKLFGGELGGPKGMKWGSSGFLFCLWLLYIILSAWKSLDSTGGASCAK